MPSYEHIQDWIKQVPGPVAVAYEAGPTGFGLSRALTGAGIRCEVVAPLKLQEPAGDGVKTDARDALHLARLLRLGEVTSVSIPSVNQEACRDLVRAGEDCRGDLMRARHRLSKLLLRHGIVYHGGAAWTRCSRSLAARAGGAEVAEARVGIGDGNRFTGNTVGSFVGLVPWESSSGSARSQGPITKTGNTHARRLLVEAAWHHRPKYQVRVVMRARWVKAPAAARARGHEGNHRLQGSPPIGCRRSTLDTRMRFSRKPRLAVADPRISV